MNLESVMDQDLRDDPRFFADLAANCGKEAIIPEDDRNAQTGFTGIVGRSRALSEVLELVDMVASTDSTILLRGETGTGKELVARALHDRSRRRSKPLVKINCAAIPSGLLESELFGYERGAFTGAIMQKAGRLELADQGTLFLDEIGDIPLELQPKLLRLIQEREFERLGSTRTKQVNVRVIAATHRDLEEMVMRNEFRSDLYYRLNVVPITIPPLRERAGDIPLLAQHFVRQFARQMNKQVDAISSEAMEALVQYPWPGNIRELQNIVERAVAIHVRGNLTVKKSWLCQGYFHNESPALASFVASATGERDTIGAALARARGRVSGPSGAAAILGVPPSTLESKIRSMNINKYQFKTA
ncbi:MAG: sigma-54 interaction domain-containing protein [Terracidiphilus sp.]